MVSPQLRRDIRVCWSNEKHVLIFGEPGTQKDKVASLIHYGTREAHAGAPLVRLSCAQLKAWKLFGLAESDSELTRAGALDWLCAQPRGGALLLSDLSSIPDDGPLRAQISRLLSEGVWQATDRHGAAVGDMKSAARVRVLMTLETMAASDVTADATASGKLVSLKIPPLRVRRADISDTASFYLRLLVRGRGRNKVTNGYPNPPTLGLAARHLLESAEFAGNEEELQLMLRGAVTHAERSSKVGPGVQSGGLQLDADSFWNPAWSSRLQRARADLFSIFPALRRAMRSPLWPEGLNWNFTRWIFPLVVALLMFGPQERAHNPALVVFWAYWWPLILVSFPLVGRLWCAVCPFMIYGEWMQRLRLATGAVLLPWPKEPLEKYGGWFLFILFFGILLWEELWDLENTAALSGWLLLLITAGAVTCSVFFERRLWCRYLCPIGGMNGMFAKLSILELRADRGVCTAECSSYACLKGSVGEPPGSAGCSRGLPTDGCPLGVHPSTLADNHDCVGCGTCVKACPNDSVELRLRPPGADLWAAGAHHTARGWEAALLFMLLGAVGVHHLPSLMHLLGMSGSVAEAEEWIGSSFSLHAAASVLALVAPLGLAYAADAVASFLGGSGGGRQAPKEAAAAAARAAEASSFVRLSYGWLPLVWAASLAHYMQLLGAEAGTVFLSTADALGIGRTGVPRAVLAPEVISFLQFILLVGGGGAATFLTLEIGKQAEDQRWSDGGWRARVAAQCGGIATAGSVLWPLLVRVNFFDTG